MDGETIQQQPSSPPTNNTFLNQSNNQRRNSRIILGLLVLILIIGGVVFYLGMLYAKSVKIQSSVTKQSTEVSHTQNSSANIPSVKPLPTAKTGFQQYTNDILKYGFSYPLAESLYKCPDLPCLSISRISLRVEPLDTYEVNPNDAKASIMKADLFCSADGPGSSISCQDVKVEDYTNSLGVKGFKVLRTKVVTGTGAGFPAGTYKDIAYVYLLPNVVKVGRLNFAGILFAVDNPTHANLSELTTIADTFFTY